MGRIRTIIAGAAGGIVLGILCFAVVAAAVTGVREGFLHGFIVLIASPFYLLLYIVAVVHTLVPAGMITGASAALAAILLRRPLDLTVPTITGILSGGWFGARFTAIMLEGRASQAELVAAGIAGALTLALTGAALITLLRRIQERDRTGD
ncbi:MAG: hypothetical protein JXA20_08725 [Spirochaetes bacterium]|nr:hypothetical protein [Spirochaetota bacterium]